MKAKSMKKEIEKNFDIDYPEDVDNPFVGSMFDVYEKGFEAGRKSTDLPVHIIRRLKASLKEAIKNKYDMDAISWGYQEGCLLSYGEVKEILKLVIKTNKQ